ncbi:MAG TPA: MarC family protein [Dissulfurispiraceae bacterium]|nr:MarC family protein [Dissulfurispiraceae bacterium]
MNVFNPFLLTVIPIMVAIDAPGVLPIYLALTEGIGSDEKKRIVRESVLTALLITLLFVLLGRAVFNILGILVEDFMIAGGILLLVISISDMLSAGAPRTTAPALSRASGVVPLGTPLLAGPATLTTCLLLVGNYGYFPVIFSLVFNFILAWILFDKADAIIRKIGVNGTRGITRLASLLLAAIAVKMIRMGIQRIITGVQ